MRLLLLLAAIGCTRSSGPTVAPDPVEVVVDAAPAPVTKLPPEPPRRVEAYCSDDKDCAYDDPCNAHACVKKSEGGSIDCDKSAAKPGPCVCGAHMCTLMRNAPQSGALKTGCKSNSECAFHAVTGSCTAGSPPTSIERRGGFCVCDAGTCTPEFVEPIACKTSLDCSLLEHPWRPAAASKVPRPFPPVTPCKTGSRDSVCVAGECILRLWKC